MNGKFFINNAEEIIPPVNDSKYKRILAIGDVHGKFQALKSLWKKLSVTDQDLIVFVGDYIDRGEDIAQVLQWVIEQSKKSNFIFLRGNHEQMMLNAMRKEHSGDERITWLFNGGKETILALREMKETNASAVDEVLDFADNLPLSYSIKVGGRNYFFCHAGVDPKKPLDKQEERFLLWSREEFFDHFDGKDVIISGHSPIKLFFDLDSNNPRPIKVPGRNILMVDTGAFITGGRLSAVDVLTGQYWQSGEDRQGEIIFVCAGNTCRSPMAKYIMQHLTSNKILIESAGCDADGGYYISNEAYEVLAKDNIVPNFHISKPFTAREYQNYKRVIALDREILERAKKISGGDPDNKIRLLKDDNGNEFVVNDPYITRDYDKAYAEIYRGCRTLLKELA